MFSRARTACRRSLWPELRRVLLSTAQPTYLTSLKIDKIHQSILRGDLDNLEGAGRPLDRWVNPFVDTTQDLAFDFLKRNGAKPEWVESQGNHTALNNHLRCRLRVLLIADMLRAKECGGGSGGGQANDAAILYDVRADEELCWHFTDIYNLQVPSYTLTRGRISAEYELAQARAAVLEAARTGAGTRDGAEAEGVETGLDSGRLLHLLAEAQRGVDESLSLGNQLRSERRGRSSEATASGKQQQQQQQQQQLAAQAQRWLRTPGAGMALSHSSFGLTAGTLVMNFFMAPVDKCIASFNRML